jgi:hypothetical protein
MVNMMADLWQVQYLRTNGQWQNFTVNTEKWYCFNDAISLLKSWYWPNADKFLGCTSTGLFRLVHQMTGEIIPAEFLI